MKNIYFFICLALTLTLSAQTAGDYRSRQSGNWTTSSTWETYTGTEWIDASTSPNSSSGVVSILNTHTVTINSTLTIDQTVVAEGGTLTVDLGSSENLTINNGTGDDITVNGTLNMSGVLQNEGLGLTGSGKTVINGTCNWNSGHITNTNFNIASGGVMDMEGSGECRINEDGVVNNAGTVNFAKSGVAFVMYYNGTFNNLNGGIFEATTNESIYHRNDLSWGNMPEFNNAGIFRKTTGTSTTTIYKIDFNNSGTVDVQTGTLKFDAIGADGTHSGTFTIASGAKIISTNNYIHTFQDGCEINGTGEFEFTTGGANYVNYVTGITEGLLIDTDITFKLSGDATLSGAGKLLINGTFDWTSTGNFNTGTIIVGENGHLNISGDNQKTYYYSSGADLLENYGTITWSGAGGISGGDKTIHNKSTGVIDIQNDATLLANSGIYTVINDGLIKKSAGSGTTTFAVHFTNNGTLTVETGIFYLSSSSGFTNYINDNNNGDRLEGGTYNLKGKLKYKPPNSDDTIIHNKAIIILDGASSEILLTNSGIDRNALVSLGSIASDGSLTLRDGRDFSSGAAAFTNSGTLDCGTNVFSNSGNFTNADNAWLIIGSPDGISSSGSSGNIQSSGTRTFHTGGNYKYNGTSSQITGSGLPGTVRVLTVENDTCVTLSDNLAVNADLTIASGDLDLNGQTITLGSSGNLIENSGRLCGSGTISTTRFLNDIAENVGGLGAEITTSENMGETTITRGHTVQTGVGGASIQRYYDIFPTSNYGLNATLVFHYNTEDLSGQNEDLLSLWKSEDSGSTWINSGGTVNPDANTIVLSSIGCFSRWTAADWIVPPSAPQNILISLSANSVTITWNEVAGATAYKVYSCATADGEFTEDLSGIFIGTSWTASVTGPKKFYIVKAVN